jgi:hypothetical protein
MKLAKVGSVVGTLVVLVSLVALAVGVPVRAWNASITSTIPGTRSSFRQPRR